VISAVRGTVLHLSGASAVIEVGGIGFDVTLTPAHALTLRVGHEAAVTTSLIVREDSLSLFGFADLVGVLYPLYGYIGFLFLAFLLYNYLRGIRRAKR
jgi:uncharacterized membrane protein YkvI